VANNRKNQRYKPLAESVVNKIVVGLNSINIEKVLSAEAVMDRLADPIRNMFRSGLMIEHVVSILAEQPDLKKAEFEFPEWRLGKLKLSVDNEAKLARMNAGPAANEDHGASESATVSNKSRSRSKVKPITSVPSDSTSSANGAQSVNIDTDSLREAENQELAALKDSEASTSRDGEVSPIDDLDSRSGHEGLYHSEQGPQD
jgi:hypothetical protein